MYQRNTADDCKATNKRQPRNAVTVLVSFYSRAGDCFEMMSAHLSQPIISTASPVRAAETATWAETVCDSACMCVDVSARVCVCVVEMEISQRWQGCIRTGLQCAKIPIGNIYINTHRSSQKGYYSDTQTQNEITTTSTTTTTTTQNATTAFLMLGFRNTCGDRLICN